MFRCKICGRTFYEPKPKGHYYFGKRCDGELQEGTMLFVPKGDVAILRSSPIVDKKLGEENAIDNLLADDALAENMRLSKENARLKTCRLAVKCVDCGENIWCYSDEQLDAMRKLENIEKP